MGMPTQAGTQGTGRGDRQGQLGITGGPQGGAWQLKRVVRPLPVVGGDEDAGIAGGLGVDADDDLDVEVFGDIGNQTVLAYRDDDVVGANRNRGRSARSTKPWRQSAGMAAKVRWGKFVRRRRRHLDLRTAPRLGVSRSTRQ